MIRVCKPDVAPEVLGTRGAEKTRQDCTAYLAGARDFEFDSSIYGDPEVKEALILAQHGKCCFCESKITHISYGDVEHFRPKKAWCQSKGDPLQYPGYYWLAYEWTNLFLSCQICNQRFKKNLFPLEDPATRAKDHTTDFSLEQPSFIDPARDDPETMITFHREEPIAINGNPRGEATIDSLGLTREALREERHRHLSTVETLVQIITLVEADPGALNDPRKRALIEKTRLQLAASCLDQSPYASMVRAFLST